MDQGLLRGTMQLRGSLLYSTFPIASISALVSLFATLLRKNMIFFVSSWWSAGIIHPFALQLFGLILALLVTNRVASAVRRWWEGVTAISQMLRKWHDAHSVLINHFKKDMRILEVQLQQSDIDLQTRAWAEARMHRLKTLRDKFIHWFSLMNAIALSTFQHGESEAYKNLHCKVRFFGWVSNDDEKTRRQNMDERLKQKAKEQGHEDPTEGMFHYIGELSASETVQLNLVDEKLALVGQWINEALMLADHEGLLKLPPVLAGQAHSDIAEGMKAYNDAYTMYVIHYPFIVTQVTNFLMACSVVLLPVVVERFTQAWMLTPLLSFLITLGLWTLNAVATQLEHPFGTGFNDIPVKEFSDMYLDRTMEYVRASFVDHNGQCSVHDDYSALFGTPIEDDDSLTKSAAFEYALDSEAEEMVAEQKQPLPEATDEETGYDAPPSIIQVERPRQAQLVIHPEGPKPMARMNLQSGPMYMSMMPSMYPPMYPPVYPPMYAPMSTGSRQRPPQHQWLIERAKAKTRSQTKAKAPKKEPADPSTETSKEGNHVERNHAADNLEQASGKGAKLSGRPESAPPLRSVMRKPQSPPAPPQHGDHQTDFLQLHSQHPVVMPVFPEGPNYERYENLPSPDVPVPPFEYAHVMPQHPSVMPDSEELY
jgi:predicted membrane chloride channel (bestrophin family)